jgi:ribosomal protein S18 acetylase RimI-like enzyme
MELNLSVKMAGYEDLAKIKKLAIENAVTRLSSLRGMSPEQIREIRAKDLEGIEKLLKKENTRIYIALNESGHLIGFVIVMLAFEHILTGEFQAEINDLYVLPEYRRKKAATLLLAMAEKFVHFKGLKYVSAEILTENPGAMAFFRERGYIEEVKILMTTGYEPKDREYAEFPVRFAKVYDFSKIRQLAMDSSIYSKPPTRDIDEEMMRELYALRMVDPIEARQSRDAFYLVAENQNREFVGFLLAEKEKDFFCNAPQLKLLNIAVKNEYWGKKVAHALFNQFLKAAKEENTQFIIGVIATANRRSWLFFSRVWKAREERSILAKKIV